MDAQQITFWMQQGPWALLFVALLIYVIKDSRVREAKYQDTIDKLVDKLSVVDNIKSDIDGIKKYFEKGD